MKSRLGSHNEALKRARGRKVTHLPTLKDTIARAGGKVFTGLLCGLAIGLTGCDTRDDWFQKEGEGATFIIETGDRKDTIDIAGMRYVEYTVNLLRVEEMNIFSDTLNVKVQGLTNKTQLPSTIAHMYDERDTQNTPSSMNFDHEAQPDGSWNLYYRYGYRSGFSLFQNDIPATEKPVIGYTHKRFMLKDIFNNEYYGFLRITFRGDCAPIPKLQVLDVEGKPMEKTLSLKGSRDPDGTITKYEYCIDGNIAKYRETDYRFETVKGVWQGGKAAYGGTYVTATSFDEINHAFQEAGEHTVYYRCMDNLGAWSMWEEEKVVIR